MGTGALSVLPLQLFCKLTLFPKKRALRIYIYMYESESRSVMSDSLRVTRDYTVHGILQARILEWVAFPFSRGTFWSSNKRS